MTERHTKMVNAAVWLAEQGVARIGWAAIGEGKRAGSRTGHHWQDDATDDPAAIREMLTGAHNALVIPKGRAIVIDNDDSAAWPELIAAGLPDTFAIDSPTDGHGHIYGLVPADVDMSTIPGTFEHGEIRRFDPRTGTASMVLGPWAQLPDGRVYRPRNGVREIAALPHSVIDYLIESGRRKGTAEGSATTPADAGWYIEKGRHDFLKRRARHLRGVGLTGQRLVDELKRLDTERCRPPLASESGRGLAEIERIAGWINAKIGDDPPEITINASSAERGAYFYAAGGPFPEPEDFGLAQPSPLAGVEYVDDFLRPGRLLVVAAEEGSGKSFAIDAELAVRMALAGGSFAETWPVKQTGPVLVLSEMHGDDDIARLETVCRALDHDRADLAGRYFRLPLYMAAHGRPCLAVPEWRRYIVDWCRERGVLLIVFDTATGAVDVDPWGREIQRLFRDLRAMIADYPALAIALIVHLKKPAGRGARRLSDVVGEWGRWNDVTLLMEAEGLERVRIELRKRVSRERRIVVTKRDGLLVDPRDVGGAGPKVSTVDFVAHVTARPGLDSEAWAVELGVTSRTVQRYARLAGPAIRIEGTRVKGAAKRYIYHPAHDDNGDNGDIERVSPSLSSSRGQDDGTHGDTATGVYIETPSLSSSSSLPDTDLVAQAESIFAGELKPPAIPTDTSAMVRQRRADA